MPGPFGDALEIGAGTGYFGLNLLQLGTIERADRQRHLARDAGDARGQPPSASGSRSRPSSPRPSALPFDGRELRPRLRPRGAAPHPRPATARSASSTASCAPAASSPSAASPRATATASRRCRSAPGRVLAPALAAPASAPRAANGDATARRRPRARERGRRPRLRPGRPRDACSRRPGSPMAASAARSCSRTCTAGRCARSRRAPTPTRCPGAGATSPSAATSPCSASTRPCSSRGCRRSSSTTCVALRGANRR